MEKFKKMILSISFWQSVIGAVVLVLGQYDVIPVDVSVIIAGWCGFGVVKRTTDKVIDK
jgi:hypothetical protein